MKIAISGDLKGSRTIHSFVYALARFGATIDPLPAPAWSCRRMSIAGCARNFIAA